VLLVLEGKDCWVRKSAVPGRHCGLRYGVCAMEKRLLCHRVGCVADGESPIGERDVASVALVCVAPSILWLLRLVCSVTLIWIAAAFWF
jgi:hypothetical protein